MKGLLVYKKIDYEKNNEYINWMINTASDLGIELILYFSDDFFRNGILQGQGSFDFIINRSRSYDLSLILELNNYKVFNNSTITHIGNNKLAAFKYAQKIGYQFPSVLAEWNSLDELISKPVDGHGGYGIEIRHGNYPLFDSLKFQQELKRDVEGDIRFYIINNEIVHAVIRRPREGLLSNFSKGGIVESYHYSESEKKLIYYFIRGLDIDYAGIDFFLLKNGELIFNEIEDVVGSRMLSYLGINNTTEIFLQHIKKVIECK